MQSERRDGDGGEHPVRHVHRQCRRLRDHPARRERRSHFCSQTCHHGLPADRTPGRDVTVNGFTEMLAQRAGTTPERVRHPPTWISSRTMEPILDAAGLLVLVSTHRGARRERRGAGRSFGDLDRRSVRRSPSTTSSSSQTFDDLGEEIGIPFPRPRTARSAFRSPVPGARRVRPRGTSPAVWRIIR